MTEQTTNVPTPETETPPVKKVKANKVERKDLTQELAKEYLEVKEDGYLYWVKDDRFHTKGDFAGTIRAHDQYYSLTLLGTLYSGTMLAYFIKNNEWVSKREVDPNKPKVEKEKVDRVPRKPPVFTDEQKEAAKQALKAKAEAAKKTAEVKVKAPVDKTDEPEVDPSDF